eukprot:CAMPEP_0198230410 /NCGR_PEP_ID=MMETSP1445-20131203/114649_1 /TAXON_ID=36898 /ORGANISM="Pyramimonas sp., Strain CCMP2087" /LENGTH=147 /DNA_ID=CAMNT_0043910947 /DNA_START=388 /DNA_END=831 /DNA_ORIENTATION=+
MAMFPSGSKVATPQQLFLLAGFALWATLTCVVYGGQILDDTCATCNGIAYSVHEALKRDFPSDPEMLELRVNNTCNHAGCPKRTAKCRTLLERQGPALAAKLGAHYSEKELSSWPPSNLLAVQRLLCHDLASVCAWQIYDVGLHMEL